MSVRPDGAGSSTEDQGARSPKNLISRTSSMSGPKPPAEPAHFSPPRPLLKSHHSTSLPTTPHHFPVDRSAPPPKSPSTIRNLSSPTSRPHHSASLPPLRKVTGGCKYETAMANAKRRVPYSLGPDKLDADSEPPKSFLTPAEEERLTVDMTALYDQLLPSEESEGRRRRLVEKLAMILRQRWPDYNVTVNVFGSTGNKLGTTDSDVDICITTDCRELERVCVLADFLAGQGMQRVVCISAAKVPIVKIWDPDLRLACDLNVNNPVALENTEMIRTYVEIDPRVRPLAMIIKHWSKRRVLNEAALGGTLSSYTWICMIINFLQTRHPSILPALQQSPRSEKQMLCGLNVAFDKDAAAYAGYGAENKDSLGALLFRFFRYYAYEIDFETSVMSVRAGQVITKTEKHWHLLQDNRLCVEEPFNTSRNLGNTADDTSVRGIHLELRRAFNMVSAAQLGRCCDEYEPPSSLLEESRLFERHSILGSKPQVAYPATPGRNFRLGGRSNRQVSQLPRLTNPGRRASSASTRGPPYPQPVPLTANPTQSEMSLQAQQRQYLLHDHLYLQYQYLQAQEQELRAQLHQQAFSQSRVVPLSPYGHVPTSHSVLSNMQEELIRARAGRGHQPTSTVPIRPHGLSFSNHYGSRPSMHVSTTNPPSPLLHTIAPEARRSYRRSSMTNGASAGSTRAQSQPPRPVPSPLSLPATADRYRRQMARGPHHRNTDVMASSASFEEFADVVGRAQRPFNYTHPGGDGTASEYMGYYLGPSPPLPIYSRSVVGTPLSSASGLGIQNGGISPQMLAQVSCNALNMSCLASERSSRAESETTRSGQEDNLSCHLGGARPRSRSRSSSGPVVVNGSVRRGSDRHRSLVDLYGPLNTSHFDASASDDIAVETPISSDGQSFEINDFHKSHNATATATTTTTTTTTNNNAPSLRSDQVKVPTAPKRHRGSNKASRPVAGFVDGPDLRNGSRLINPSALAGKQPPARTNDAGELAGALDSESCDKDEKDFRTGACRLSPVTETRMSAGQARGPVHDKTAQIASKAKSKGKGKARKPLPAPAHYDGRKGEALAVQPNGVAAPPLIVSDTSVANGKALVNGWQMPKRKPKHKRGSKSETDLKGVNVAGGELLPVHDRLRKGG